ncbi:MAG: bifunctional glutamate N-acetyltransferase/amino-acid acetyltransferase ArgJ [Deltaproteobacteria bacterium]|nr:bifunctional glutamate N-acetyltransferase/amino-acid acetyltransferase ArgJ [Deltaproteobacteria bacterium]
MAKIRVPGFQFAGVACGIKKSKKKDLALIFSDRPATAAAIFTTNRVKAAPVLVGMKRIRRGMVQAIVINSGNANACTGSKGVQDAEAMCRQVAFRLGVDPKLVFPSSTGLIGMPLPMSKVRGGIEKATALLSPQSFSQAAEAILTTDRFSKVSSTWCNIGGQRVVVVGMAKGAGMVAPRMATMLAYILTDAAVQSRCLQRLLSRAANETFNCITVDGDSSTNDTVLFLANGVAGNRVIALGSKEEQVLFEVAKKVMKDLALKLVKDGEGATKLVEIRVERSRSVADAKKIAYAVANSLLVKTAFFGADPNLGRIMAAIGYAGVRIEPSKIGVSFDRVHAVRNGIVLNANERKASRVLRRPSFKVCINLGQGKESASVWTSDLSYEYVRINSAYRT